METAAEYIPNGDAAPAKPKRARAPKPAGPTFAEAFLAAQREFEPLARDNYNPETNHHFTTLSALMQAVLPILHKHAMTVEQVPTVRESGSWLMLRTVITYVPTGETKESLYPVCDGRELAQTKGTCLTYARRYSLPAMLGVASRDMPDVDAQGAPKDGAAQPPPPKAPPKGGREETRTVDRSTSQERKPAPQNPSQFRKSGEAQWANDALDECATEDELDELFASDRWLAIPVQFRRNYDDKIAVIRNMIRDAGGEREVVRAWEKPTFESLKAELEAIAAHTASSAERDATVAKLTVETLGQFTNEQRAELRALFEKTMTAEEPPTSGGAGEDGPADSVADVGVAGDEGMDRAPAPPTSSMDGFEPETIDMFGGT